MASASPCRRLTPQTFAAVFLLMSGGGVPVSCFKVTEGGVASLSCQYSVQRYGLSRVCWGRGCGTLWCSNILIQTDENGVISKTEERYRMTGDVLEGQMDLDIADVRRSDSGPYCCRVDIDGIFNDKKVIMNLRVVKASINRPTTGSSSSTISTTTAKVTEASTSGVIRKTQQLPQLDKRNSTVLHSTTIAVLNPPASLSLHISVPVLSLSLTALITVAAVFLSLAFRRGLYRPGLRSGCFSSEEPPHIIYEIRMRRPVQENIYTLD
ncbi:T-cell immunoglobulin and mucin domain-containing protein 4 [Syngnathoides biaculeatus]|uniref:T-cell immunoglobulin and mucin domain-containing protein 4 n=1 Tax=Syngnathoides biaculeatus TaxID=300417 RepID=UPI002ADD8D7A|nr:T-cell immunoglobulin and mucin domain-containing protein 4 [Syngnathoides biaculeatus]